MQASQALRAAGENEEVFKARAVSESTKQSPKSSYTRAERRQKLALEKKSMERSKRSKQEQAKPVEVPLNGVADFTTSTELQSAEERLASIEASTRKSQERPRVEDKDASENDNKGSGPGEQTATAQKLKDIMDILESSRSQNLPRNPMKVARKAKIPSKDTKRKAAIVATLNELENSGENPDVDHREAAAMISYFSNQLLAHLKESPEETPGSLHELRVIVQTSSDVVED